jgi:hypothetical protein
MHPINENVIRLEKCHVPAIVNLMQPHNTETPRAKSIFGENAGKDKNTESMRWILTELTEYWLKKQEIWGYVDRNNDNRLEACVFWEPPENGESSLRWLLMKDSAKGFFKMGPKAYYHLIDKFQSAQELTSKEVENRKAIGIIHYFCLDQENFDEKKMENISEDLLFAVCEYVSTPTLAVLHKDDTVDTAITKKFFEKTGFLETHENQKQKDKGGLIVMKREKPGRFAYKMTKPQTISSPVAVQDIPKMAVAESNEKVLQPQKSMEKMPQSQFQQQQSLEKMPQRFDEKAPQQSGIDEKQKFDERQSANEKDTLSQPEKRFESEKMKGSV